MQLQLRFDPKDPQSDGSCLVPGVPCTAARHGSAFSLAAVDDAGEPFSEISVGLFTSLMKCYLNAESGKK